jgi:hypothetical protein
VGTNMFQSGAELEFYERGDKAKKKLKKLEGPIYKNTKFKEIFFKKKN